MNARVAEFPPLGSLIFLSRLLLQPASGSVPFAPMPDAPALMPSRDEFEDILALAHLNHVVVRGVRKVPHTGARGAESCLVSVGG
jgi:hypothetical protein